MYTACLFCHADLGRNETIEAFPVGRRLAFDAAKGRLWVVCRRCERWNLTPLEERWEAIEQAERAFRGTKLRVSTDNIGMARLAEGLALVRVGSPLRPEMAAWRYGDQFGRRRRRQLVTLGGAATAAAALAMGAPLVAAAVGASPLLTLVVSSNLVQRWMTPDPRDDVHVALGDGDEIRIAGDDIPLVQLLPDGDEARLLVVVSNWSRRVHNDIMHTRTRHTREVRGEDIARITGAILPQVNRRGGSGRDVERAVRTLDEAPSVERLYRQVASQAKRLYDARLLPMHEEGALANVPAPLRLALEMAAHEEQERRALEGELRELERAWLAAEEIARIADGMLVDPAVASRLDAMKKT